MKTKTKFIGGEKVGWRALKSAFGKGHKADVAVAFLGDGAHKRLRLSKGSLLVVDASEDIVRNGLTDPEEIQKFRKRGVRVFHYKDLHAKVFVLKTRAFVGSANVSNSSADKLAEALISTNDSKVVAAARRFVRNCTHTEIGPEYLKSLQKIYRPPRPSNGTHPGLDFIWAIDLPIASYSKAADSAREKGIKKAKRKLRSSRYFEVADFQTSHRELSRIALRDFVLQRVRESQKPHRLYPIGIVVHIEEFQDQGEDSGIVFLECRKGTKSVLLKQFQAKVGAVAEALSGRNKILWKLTNKTLLAQLRHKLGSKL